MKKIYIIILLLSVFFLITCNKKEEIINSGGIIGAWEEKMPYVDGICDTIVFTNDNRVEYYRPLEGFTYTVFNDTIHFFTNDRMPLKCQFLLEEETLTIFKFIPNSDAPVFSDISFTKITKL
jgi:hypothetical protein